MRRRRVDEGFVRFVLRKEDEFWRGMKHYRGSGAMKI